MKEGLEVVSVRESPSELGLTRDQLLDILYKMIGQEYIRLNSSMVLLNNYNHHR